MAQMWFYNIPYHGHVNPTLPLMRELVRRGDQVTYFSSPPFADRIEATGATFRPYRDSTALEQSRRDTHTVHVGSLVAEATYDLLPEVLAAVENERPDYLMFDMSAPWGSIAGRRFGIPSIASFPHFPFNWRTVFDDRRVLHKVVESIRPGFGHWRKLQRQTIKIVKEFNLRNIKDINVLSSSAETNIVFTSRYFQPFEEDFDSSYHYIGPTIETDRREEPMVITRRADQRLIYIAVGTVYQANMQFFRHCLQAFDNPGYAVVLSVGQAIDPAELEPFPTNFTVAQYVPQLSVLKEADLFITHGGMNSIAESISYGVPMIVAPNTLEQSINAARIEQLGAGFYLDHAQINVETLRKSAKQILGDASLVEGVKRIRESFHDAGGIQKAAAAIQDFKHKHGLNHYPIL